MNEHREADEGRFAVPGPESHESEQSLSPDERGSEARPAPPPSEPKQPTATPLARGGGAGIWTRIARALKLRS